VKTIESKQSGEPGTELVGALHESYQQLGRLLHHYRDYLLRIVAEEVDPRLKNRHAASDIVQTTVVKILANFDRASEGLLSIGTEEDLRRWLRKACLTTLYLVHRDEGRGVRNFRKDEPISDEAEQPVVGPSPSSAFGHREREEALINAVNALPEADRILLRLRQMHGWKYADLAELIDGMSTESGRVRMQRRITRLYFTLGENETVKGLA
jgi:RNA polymerase sigma factor (sigma-70 family)